MAAGAGCERGVRHGAVALLVAVRAGLVAAAGSRPTGAGAAAAGTGTTDRTRTTAGTGTTEGSDTTDSEPTSELAFIPGPATTQPVLLPAAPEPLQRASAGSLGLMTRLLHML